MNILIFYRHFPVAMGRYIHWGLEQAGHQVWSCGPYSHGTIPWGDYKYPEKYWRPPTIETPDIPLVPADELFKTIKEAGLKPDLFISAADTYFVGGKCPVPHILVGTDPHVVDYESHLDNVHFYISMQKFYSNGYAWMPYAYDPEIHKDLHLTERKYDVVFCGLQYEHRMVALQAMKDKGLRVFNALGLIYDEYVEIYNQGAIAFNWSSKNDLPARFWEGLAMGRCVLTNRVPDLQEFDCKDMEHYVGFDTIEEAVEKAIWLKNNPADRMDIAENGWHWVRKHTYKNRIKKIVGFSV